MTTIEATLHEVIKGKDEEIDHLLELNFELLSDYANALTRAEILEAMIKQLETENENLDMLALHGDSI